MNIKELSVEQLKSLVYDHSKNIQGSQQSIQVIENELNSRKQVSTNGSKETVQAEA